MSAEQLCTILTWNNTSSATEASNNIGHQVAIQVWRDKHIKLLRLAHQLHAGVVYNDLRSLDHGILLGYLSELLQHNNHHIVDCFNDSGNSI